MKKLVAWVLLIMTTIGLLAFWLVARADLTNWDVIYFTLVILLSYWTIEDERRADDIDDADNYLKL